MPLSRPPRADPPGRPRHQPPDLQRLHRRPHLPRRRGLGSAGRRFASVASSAARRCTARTVGDACGGGDTLALDVLRGACAMGARIASEAACEPTSAPRLAPRGRSSIRGRRSPDGSCSRPEGWAARLSPRRTGVAPSYLALLRVEFAAFHSGPERPASSLWHWSSPCGGRALPATLRWGARTFLTPRGCPPDARPSGRLAGPRIVGDGSAEPASDPDEGDRRGDHRGRARG